MIDLQTQIVFVMGVIIALSVGFLWSLNAIIKQLQTILEDMNDVPF